MLQREKFLQEAIRLSLDSVEKGGGPFGAVVVKDNTLIASGANEVTLKKDPTAHAEIVAIRNAARALGSHDLSGCDIYASCEPCPMCLSAIYWAGIARVYYGNSREDADEIGFSDLFISEEFLKDPVDRKVKMQQMLSKEAYSAFKAWKEKEDKTSY